MASGKPSRSEVDSDNLLESAVLGLQSFANDASTFLGLCHKESPGIDKYRQDLAVTAVGFAVMGVIGFGVKLVHIPINSLLLS